MRRLRPPKPIAVLGAGPAGLLAAHAVAEAGRQLDIFALGPKSRLIGPQYLYQQIPKVTPEEPEGYVRQVVRGTMTDYRRKLYGNVDPQWVERPMEPGYQAWNLREAYDRLWDLYGNLVTPAEIDAETIAVFLSRKVYSLILSTIPPSAFCYGQHQFTAWRILVADVNIEPIEENTIVFNGEPSPSWIRESNIFGRQTTEWPVSMIDPGNRRSRPPVPTYTFEKPLRTNCDCFLPFVMRMGRFGTWRNETWAHDAYNRAKEAVG